MSPRSVILTGIRSSSLVGLQTPPDEMHGCVDGGGEEKGGGQRFGELTNGGLFRRVSSESNVSINTKSSLKGGSDHGCVMLSGGG